MYEKLLVKASKIWKSSTGTLYVRRQEDKEDKPKPKRAKKKRKKLTVPKEIVIDSN